MHLSDSIGIQILYVLKQAPVQSCNLEHKTYSSGHEKIQKQK